MSTKTVVLHCNAGGTYGLGHLVRCAVLGEEAIRRGWEAHIVGDIDAQARALLAVLAPRVTVCVIPATAGAAELTAASDDASPAVVHIDSYRSGSDALAHGPAIISNMQDGDFGVRPADIGIDANLGADRRFARPDLTRIHLAGGDYAVVRQQVRALRGLSRPRPTPPRVLIVLGGTDPHGATGRVLEGFNAVESATEITVIAPSATSELIEQMASTTHHSVVVRTFTNDLVQLAHDHTLVVTAAGTSVWDFACMGLPMAVVCVTENQVPVYNAAIAAGVGVPFKASTASESRASAHALTSTLHSLDALRRLAQNGRDAVDGLGAWRIVSAWEDQLASMSRVPRAGEAATLTLRRATMADARTLFDWRNDAATRAVSKSAAPLSWAGHCEWLALAIASSTRLLFIAERAGVPVGTSRWDQRRPGTWEISLTIAPTERRRGLGHALVAASEQKLVRLVGAARITATVHRDNVASRRLFLDAGYVPIGRTDGQGFVTFVRRMTPGLDPPVTGGTA